MSESGVITAAPSPWIARDAISASVLGASAAAADASEHPYPSGEHGSPAQPIAERGRGEQENGKAQRVRVDGPLELLERGAEVLADAHQRIGHDQVVERDHEEGDRDDREGPEAALALHCSPLLID
ncbi:MAG TPA: hypothetical protein VI122_00630 [Thermoleophilaceae bacterium]